MSVKRTSGGVVLMYLQFGFARLLGCCEDISMALGRVAFGRVTDGLRTSCVFLGENLGGIEL